MKKQNLVVIGNGMVGQKLLDQLAESGATARYAITVLCEEPRPAYDRVQLTAIMITHDVDEAILLGDRVVMMTNGPEARVGKILEVDLPRPRSRRELLSHPRYYELRESLIQFLAECDHARH